MLTDTKPCDDTKDLVLLGSEKTNILTKELSENFENKQQKDYSPLIMETANIGDRKILIIYSKKEVENIENRAAAKSPLNNIIDEKYVPATATFLSILLMYL